MYMKTGGFSGHDVMKRDSRPRHYDKQSGATLLEVLVSIIVFSLGMIGMLGLVISSLQMTSTSNYRSIAAEQLAAIADTLNANPTMINDYLAAAGSGGAGSAGSATCFTDVGCTNAQLAATEYRLWQDRAAALLPAVKSAAVKTNASLYRSNRQGTWTPNGQGRPVARICWDESRVSSAIGWGEPCFFVEL